MMSIVGFNFTKINAERKSSAVGQVSINNNISIVDVAEAKLGLIGDRGALRVTFRFTTKYTPELATIVFEGEVMLLVSAKQQEELIAQWKQNRSIKRELVEPLMNYILDRCNIQALLVAKDLNLPSPVQLPKVKVSVPDASSKAAPAAEEKTDKPKKKK